MGHTSLGEFIDAARVADDVKDIHGADLDADVGALSELSAQSDGPLLLFHDFAGFPSGFRVASNVYRHSRRRYALALGIPSDAHPVELVQHLRKLRARQVPAKPRRWRTAPSSRTGWPVRTRTFAGSRRPSGIPGTAATTSAPAISSSSAIPKPAGSLRHLPCLRPRTGIA